MTPLGDELDRLRREALLNAETTTGDTREQWRGEARAYENARRMLSDRVEHQRPADRRTLALWGFGETARGTGT